MHTQSMPPGPSVVRRKLTRSLIATVNLAWSMKKKKRNWVIGSFDEIQNSPGGGRKKKEGRPLIFQLTACHEVCA